jgi:hypothetical protein
LIFYNFYPTTRFQCLITITAEEDSTRATATTTITQIAALRGGIQAPLVALDIAPAALTGIDIQRVTTAPNPSVADGA